MRKSGGYWQIIEMIDFAISCFSTYFLLKYDRPFDLKQKVQINQIRTRQKVASVIKVINKSHLKLNKSLEIK